MAQTTERTWDDVLGTGNRVDVPADQWMRCSVCERMLFRKLWEENLCVCAECGHHSRVSAPQRCEQLCDPGSFEAKWTDVGPSDPLKFKDVKSYRERIKAEQKKASLSDAILAGTGYIKGRRAVIAALDPNFMMGSMGSVVGEVLTRSIELAMEHDWPLVTVACSGGARMQESGLSLMQMAKTSAALAQFDDAGGLYVSVLTDPTTGGVTASFAMLGDVIFAEPKALIGFAGPRVIVNTVKQDLPEGFQRAEFLVEKGFVDRVVARADLRSEISRVIDYASK
ncbi:MAG: acetyl-CoA carboxylase carboxyl transferase subunit beta [Planctomycetaceae bacterium]|nr:acetyl-CoA carboxylase carboxyl transferase subunit beta [Planctomycetaceae bacterium]